MSAKKVDGSRRIGRRRKSWKYNIKEWRGQSLLSSLCIADDKSRWEMNAVEVFVAVPPTTLGRHGCQVVRSKISAGTSGTVSVSLS